MTVFGTSAKFIDAVRKAELAAARHARSVALRMLTSTGSPLAPESFDFVYDAIKPDVHLASISGGTDIVSCFVLGIPTKPGLARRDPGARPRHGGRRLRRGGPAGARREGRTRLHAAVSLMPVSSGTIPDGAKYRAAYFERFPGIWATATSPNGRRTAASSSTAAPTPRSIPAACASARRRSTRRSRACRRCSRRSPSARIGTATCASCCSCGWRDGVALTTRSPQRSRAKSAPAPRRATCRRRSSPSPTFRARSPARSPSSRCATSCMGAR